MLNDAGIEFVEGETGVRLRVSPGYSRATPVVVDTGLSPSVQVSRAALPAFR
jgi:hypothetical protein